MRWFLFTTCLFLFRCCVQWRRRGLDFEFPSSLLIRSRHNNATGIPFLPGAGSRWDVQGVPEMPMATFLVSHGTARTGIVAYFVPMNPVNTTFFVVERLLGQGGYGVVVKVRQEWRGRWGKFGSMVRLIRLPSVAMAFSLVPMQARAFHARASVPSAPVAASLHFCSLLPSYLPSSCFQLFVSLCCHILEKFMIWLLTWRCDSHGEWAWRALPTATTSKR